MGDRPQTVRLTAGSAKQLRRLSEETNVSVSALIRLAVKIGIPALVARFGSADETTARKAC